MPIETVCQGCAAKLRVPDEFAGRKARCPNCRTVYTVPESVSPQRTDAATSERWRLRTEDGTIYGPVPKADLDRWAAEGRVTAGSQLQRDGETMWHNADRVFPSLEGGRKGEHAGPQKLDPHPVNPYAAPMASSVRPVSTYLRPHRAGLVLTLGIVGLLCCPLLGPAAWVMGQADMREMDAGRMDPGGRGVTQAGVILGIVGTILLALGIGIQVIALAVSAM